MSVLYYYPYEEFAWRVDGLKDVFPDVSGDDMDDSFKSTLILLEDGVPLPLAHKPHNEIISIGNGRYSHWVHYFLFSVPGNTNPLTNGKKYEISDGKGNKVALAEESKKIKQKNYQEIEDRLARRRAMVVDVDAWFRHHGGYSWCLVLPGFWQHHEVPDQDVVEVYEDGKKLVPVTDVGQVFEYGGGRYFLQPPYLFLSASDNTNPKLNGRVYEIVGSDGARKAIPFTIERHVLANTKTKSSPELEALVRAAYEEGKKIDIKLLSTQPGMPGDGYYHFLAGFLRHLKLRRVVEVGTEHGWSASAMVQGMGEHMELLVTMDIADRTRDYPEIPGLHRLIGDAGRKDVFQKVLDLCDNKPIDLLFVDAAHEYEPTMMHYASYAALLRPKYVIFDDIVLSESMAALWRDLVRSHNGYIINACDVEPRVRTAECGFGIIDLSGYWKKS